MNATGVAARSRLAWAGRQAAVWACIGLVVAVSWVYLIRMEAQMSAMAGAGTAGQPVAATGVAGFMAVFMMWAIMMMAMMLPTVLPSSTMFATLAMRRDPKGARWRTASYVAGYAACWIGFAFPAAVLHGLLADALLLDPMARSANTILSGVILAVAGLYQFTATKHACLSKCRTPLGFFMARWRDGALGALRVGFGHGAYCVACCWALMAVMFVVGAMNIAWMGILTALMLGEKVIAPRWRFDRMVGIALLLWGGWVLMAATLA